MKRRKSLAFILCLAMALTMMPTFSVFATNNGLIGVTKAKLTLVYMNYLDSIAANPTSAAAVTTSEERKAGRDAEEPIIEEKGSIPTLNVGDAFFVGIKVSDINQISEASDGMANISLGIVFDPNYLDAETMNSTNATPYLTNRSGGENKEALIGNYGEYSPSSSIGIADNNDGTKTFRFGMTTTNINPPYKGEGTQYLGFVKFTVKDVPPAGKADVLGVSKSGEIFQIGFGPTGSSGSYAAGGVGAADILKLFELKSDLNIFPVPKTLSGIEKNATAPDLSSLIAGNTLDLSGVTVKANYTDGTSAPAIKPTGFIVASTTPASTAGAISGSALNLDKTEHNTKHLYAFYTNGGVTKYADLGELTVTDAVLTQIEVTTEPKLTYAAGDRADLNRLEVKLTYNNNNTENVTYGAFASKGLIVKVENDTITHDSTPITKAMNGKKFTVSNAGGSVTGETTNTITVSDAAVSGITCPGIKIDYEYGEKLVLPKVDVTYSDGTTGSEPAVWTLDGKAVKDEYYKVNDVNGKTLTATYGGQHFDVTLTMTKREIQVTSVNLGVVYENEIIAANGELTIGTGSGMYTATGIVTGDAVTINYSTNSAIDTSTSGEGQKASVNLSITSDDYTITPNTIEATYKVSKDPGVLKSIVLAQDYKYYDKEPLNTTSMSALFTYADGGQATKSGIELKDYLYTGTSAADAQPITIGTKLDKAVYAGGHQLFAAATDTKGNRVTSTGITVVFFDNTAALNSVTSLGGGVSVLKKAGFDGTEIEFVSTSAITAFFGWDGANWKDKKYYAENVATAQAISPETTPYAITASENNLYVILNSGGGGGGSHGSGGGGGSSVVSGITLNKSSVDGVVGGSETLTASLKNVKGTVNWKSSDEKVATVDKNGKITFVGVGTATITASVTEGSKTYTDTVKVTVKTKDEEVKDSMINKDYLQPYVTGYPGGAFLPDKSLTRAEAAAMISKILKDPIDMSKSYDFSMYTDVSAEEWYGNFIGFLSAKGIITGYTDKTFRPNEEVSRAELSTMLAKADALSEESANSRLIDVSDHWAAKYINAMSQKGYISGYPDNTFLPNKAVTRAETVTVINSMLKTAEISGSNAPTDMDASHWAYNAVLKAMNTRIAQ